MTANEAPQRADDSTSEASPAMRALQSAPQSITADRGEANEAVASGDALLSEILQATASSFTAARAVMETAAQTAFAFFADASEADRAALMEQFSACALSNDAMLSGYANALDGGDDPNALVKQHGYRSVAELLQHELGRRRHDTAQLIRLGHVIRDGTYPTLAVGVKDGRVSLHQAGVIVSVLDEQAPHYCLEDIEAVEAAATDFATGCDTALPLKPEQLQKLVRAWFKQRQPEKVELDTTEHHRLRSCTYGTNDDGMIRLRALLPAADGAAVMQFLDANAAPKVRFTDPDQTESTCCCTDPENRCGALHLSDAGDSDAGGSNGAAGTGDVRVTMHCPDCAPIDTRTRQQKMADAFTHAFQVAAKTKETSKQGSAAPTVTITIPIAELEKHANGIPALATVQRTEEIVPAHVAARILCDGAIRAAITGEHGEVLHLGRSHRLFNPAQRTALNLEYPTCAVDDCDIPAVWCEAHHVLWWSRGGATDIDNGVLLCNYHHHQVHTGNLTIVSDTGRRRWRMQRAARMRNDRSSGKARPGRFLVDLPPMAPSSSPRRAKPPDPADRRSNPSATSGDTNTEQNTGSTTGASKRPKHRGDRPRNDKSAPDDDDDSAGPA